MQNEQNDLEFILTPDRWPCWPKLPLKKAKDLAVLMFWDENEYYIYEGANLWSGGGSEGRRITPEEVVREGWRVD